MRVMTLFILILFLIGILINFIPSLTYYFGTVTHVKYYNVFPNGISLVYNGTYTLFANEKVYNYGFIMNITKLNASYYLVQSKLYLLNSSVRFNKNHFPQFNVSIIKEIGNYSEVVNINNSTFLRLFFPEGDVVKIGSLTFSIPPPSANTFLSKFFGITKFSFLMVEGSVIEYVKYGSQYVMANFINLGLGPFSSTNISAELFKSMFPNYSVNETGNSTLQIELVYGNGIPGQDWLEWFRYGFAQFVPLNIILIVSAGVLAIYDYRKTH